MENFKLEPNDQITKRIEETKLNVRQTLPKYQDAVKKLRDALKEKLDREAKARKKQNENTARALALATEKYNGCYACAEELYAQLAELISAIREDYEKIIYQISILDSKAAPKKEKEYAAYMADYDAQKKKIDDLVGAAGVTFSIARKSAPEEEVAVPTPAVAIPGPVAVAQAEEVLDTVEEESADVAPEMSQEIAAETPATALGGINLAPINIDITSTVERAVKQAMDKFASSLEYRIDEYFENYEPKLPAQQMNVGSAVSEEGIALEAKIAEDEEALIDKLVGMVETLKNLNNAMATVTATYAQLDARFKEAIALQRQTNDMMRHTMREQQGVQVNQRVISKDQLDIVEEQNALIDAQKAALEEQKQVGEAQAALAQTQKTIIETQTTLEGAMKAVMQEQKRIISAQQAIVAENEKSAKTQEAIAERQNEISTAQKELLSAQKQVLKEQKATNERQKEAAEVQRAVNADVKEALKEQRTIAARIPSKKA